MNAPRCDGADLSVCAPQPIPAGVPWDFATLACRTHDRSRGLHEEWVLRDDFLDDDDPRWLTGKEPVYGITEEDAILLEATGSIVLSRWRAK